MSNENSVSLDSVMFTLAENADLAFVQYGSIGWSHARMNVTRETRRPDAEVKGVRKSLAKTCWDANRGIVQVFNRQSPIWESYQDVINGPLVLNEDMLKNPGILLGSIQGREFYRQCMIREGRTWEFPIFRAAFCTGPDTWDLTPIIFLNNTCHCRLECYYSAMLDRVQGTPSLTPDKEGYRPKLPASFHIPTLLSVFPTEAERRIAQENENKAKEYRTEVTTLDKLRNLSRLFEAFPTLLASQAIESYPGHVGQYGYLIVQLDSMWRSTTGKAGRHKDEGPRPDLKILSRFLDFSSSDPRYLDFSKTYGCSALYDLRDRSHPDTLLKANNYRVKANAKIVASHSNAELLPMLTPIDAAELEKSLTDLFGKDAGRNKPKGLKLKAWEGFKNQDDLVGKIAQEAIDGKTDTLTIMRRNSDLFDTAMTAVHSGEGVSLTNALNHPDWPTFLELTKDKEGRRIKMELIDPIPVPEPSKGKKRK